MRSYSRSVGEWDFPVFTLDDESNHTPLYAMGYAMFVAHDLIKKFNIDEKKLDRFLRTVNDGYRKNHYHNAIHAADVTQTVNFFLRTGPMAAGNVRRTVIACACVCMCVCIDACGAAVGFRAFRRYSGCHCTWVSARVRVCARG